MKNLKIILSVVMFGVLVFIAPACSGNTADDPDSGEPQGVNGFDPADTAEPTEDTPEFPVTDMGGREFKILTAGWWGAEFMEVRDLAPEEQTADPLNDAAYNRKAKIEELYNCRIVQIQGEDEAVSLLQTAVRAGDQAYDIAMIRGINFAGLLTDNYIIEMSELENIDFENPWWRQKSSDALLIGGKRFGLSGSISTREISLAALVMFNKTITGDYNLESPYELVQNGGWTIDKMAEMSRQVSRDLNGDGIMTEDDMWGISYDRDRVWNLLNGCGIKLMETDSGGALQITVDADGNISKIQNILSVFYDEAYSANTRRIPVDFRQDNVLFRFEWAVGAVDMREYDTDFGIIPVPKYNAAQPEYMPNVYGLGVPIICVPSVNSELADTGLFMEVLSYEGYRNVIPVFYENILKTRTARDDESEEMIEYIFNNLHYDTGTFINFGGFAQDISMLAEDLNANIASFVERNKPRLERELQRITE
ncbi:MAG: hypothetical protein FWH24_03070 [Oscillospiraceae bacterium]|nr:hypothetical protein [Oscillospiraceae bacterium]